MPAASLEHRFLSISGTDDEFVASCRRSQWRTTSVAVETPNRWVCDCPVYGCYTAYCLLILHLIARRLHSLFSIEEEDGVEEE